jgi:hypothetical protein
MPTYQRANDGILAMMEEIREKFHGQLTEADVSTGLLLAYGSRNQDGERTSDALTKGGLRLAGLAKVVGLRERTAGLPDTLVVMDGDRWDDWSEEKQKALIDHELTHFEVQFEPEIPGVWKTDDLGRPIVKIKPHDFEVGWFESVARRWGVSSFEVEQASQIAPGGQLIFPWAAKGPPAEDMAEAGDVVANTFAALLTVGNTEPQARRMIDRVSEGGRTFESVAAMIDACYTLQLEEVPPDTIKLQGKAKPKGKGKPKSRAQQEAEAEAEFNAKP